MKIRTHRKKPQQIISCSLLKKHFCLLILLLLFLCYFWCGCVCLCVQQQACKQQNHKETTERRLYTPGHVPRWDQSSWRSLRGCRCRGSASPGRLSPAPWAAPRWTSSWCAAVCASPGSTTRPAGRGPAGTSCTAILSNTKQTLNTIFWLWAFIIRTKKCVQKD